MDFRAQEQAARAHRLIRNPAYGHEGGRRFDVTDADVDADAKLDGIAVWTHTVAGDQTALKAMKLHWNDDNVVQYGNPNSTQPDQTMLIDADEKMVRCNIYASDWVDAIYLETNKRAQRLGGSGGEEYKQSVGDGNLVGFHGSAGSDIDRLGTVFEARD